MPRPLARSRSLIVTEPQRVRSASRQVGGPSAASDVGAVVGRQRCLDGRSSTLECRYHTNGRRGIAVGHVLDRRRIASRTLISRAARIS